MTLREKVEGLRKEPLTYGETCISLRAVLALIPEGAVLVTAEELAAALIESELVKRLADYAIRAHPETMSREETNQTVADSWAAAILARIREAQG